MKKALDPSAGVASADRDDGLALRPFLEVCLGASDSTLVEAGREAELVGLVEVKEGRIWRCIHQDHEGDRALRELLEERFDEIVIRRGARGHNARNVFGTGLPPEPRLRTVEADSPASEPASAAEAASAAAPDFASLWDAGVSALLERDLSRAFGSFQSAALLRPDDPKVLANLVRLRDLGFGGPGSGDPGSQEGGR